MRTLLLAAIALSFSSPTVAVAQTFFLDDATVVAPSGTQSKTDIIVVDGFKVAGRGYQRQTVQPQFQTDGSHRGYLPPCHLWA